MDKGLILNEIKHHYKFEKNADFANFLGISAQVLYNWYKRNVYDIEILYTKCVEINPDWLISGSGPMLRTEPKKTTEEVQFSPDKYDQLEKEIRNLTHDLSKKCIDLTTTLAEQQTRLTEIISSQQRIIEELTKKD